ncbi:hypothetical protein LXA43DRAFT_893833 [Ganoderma leucocontextum]|nr:hypothetical protein LXA43DRAFT_893833 [Ganoderma leucocontextum]
MAHPHVGNTVLGDAENIVIVSLPTITMVYINLALYFATWEYDPDTDEEREICCTQFTGLPSYLDVDPQLKVPILFEIIGQISPEECFLTADGYESPESNGQDDQRLATCWIETREDYISQIYWLGIAPAVQEIANQIPTDVDTSRLLTDEQGEDVRLQVMYQPPAGQSIASTLPLYNSRGEHRVPSHIAEVPFGRPVRVAFTFESCYCRGEPERERVLIAVLEHMAVM